MLDKIELRSSDGHTATVYLQGATVTSWTSPVAGELLFLSRDAVFEEGKPIRGGIPIVFPQFSGQGPLPTHGFARTATWSIASQEEAAVTFKLTTPAPMRSVWGHECELRYSVATGAALVTELAVKNLGASPFSFQSALHTYFRVGAITRTAVPGLKGFAYLDNLLDGEPCTEAADPVEIRGETDRIYTDVPNTVEINDLERKLIITLEKANFADAVLWNPWVEKAKRLQDLEDSEFREFVCLECGNIARKITLEPGEEYTMSQKVTYKVS